MIFFSGQLYGGDDVKQDNAKIGNGQVGIVIPDPEEI